eukprot:scaffold1525_cov142-Cylindrotheca_fusiformis.AAC.165
MQNQQIDLSTIDFTALSLNESQSGMFRGWGSEETRKAYTSLQQLAESNDSSCLMDSQPLKRCSTSTAQKPDDRCNGFFISEDDMEIDGIFW